MRESCRVEGIARGGQRAGQHVVVRLFPQQVRFQEHLDELFDKQGHAIGPGHHLLDHLRGQGLAACHPHTHLSDLGSRQTTQRQRREVGAEAPGGVKLRAAGQQGEQTGRRSLVEEEGEEFQRRGINPVHVLDNEQHGLFRRQRQ
jgi:hypothetical protein